MEINDNFENQVEVFTRYITKNGKRIYPKNARFFHFWVPAVRQQQNNAEKTEPEKKPPENPVI